MQFVYEPFPENTPAGKEFQRGWKAYVEQQAQSDVFWDPVDARWETYAFAKYDFVGVGMTKVDVGTSYWSEVSMLREVLNIGHTSRVFDKQVVWDPRNGYWYRWSSKARPVPRSPSSVPDWLRDLNNTLDSISSNTHLTPQEKHEARAAAIEAAYKEHH